MNAVDRTVDDLHGLVPQASEVVPPVLQQTTVAKPVSTGPQRCDGRLVLHGVLGASLLGPLTIPTTSAAVILVGRGTARRWTLLWPAVAIAVWTAAATLATSAALTSGVRT